MLERISFDRGLHLRGTQLWLDAERRRELCVLTSLAMGLPPVHDRSFATSSAVEALRRAGFKGQLMPTAFERWVTVAGVEFQLLPTPGPLGPAVVLINSGGERILVTGLVRAQPASLPRDIDLLVATVPALEQRGATLERTLKGLDLFCEQAASEGARATVLCGSLEAATELFAAMWERGRTPRALGLLARLTSDRQGASAKLAVGTWDARVGANTRVAWVDCGLMTWRQARGERAQPQATFRLRWYADWAMLQQVVAATTARQVALIGAGSTARAQAARKLGSSVETRFLGNSRQLTLTS